MRLSAILAAVFILATASVSAQSSLQSKNFPDDYPAGTTVIHGETLQALSIATTPTNNKLTIRDCTILDGISGPDTLVGRVLNNATITVINCTLGGVRLAEFTVTGPNSGVYVENCTFTNWVNPSRAAVRLLGWNVIDGPSVVVTRCIFTVDDSWLATIDEAHFIAIGTDQDPTVLQINDFVWTRIVVTENRFVSHVRPLKMVEIDIRSEWGGTGVSTVRDMINVSHNFFWVGNDPQEMNWVRPGGLKRKAIDLTLCNNSACIQYNIPAIYLDNNRFVLCSDDLQRTSASVVDTSKFACYTSWSGISFLGRPRLLTRGIFVRNNRLTGPVATPDYHDEQFDAVTFSAMLWTVEDCAMLQVTNNSADAQAESEILAARITIYDSIGIQLLNVSFNSVITTQWYRAATVFMSVIQFSNSGPLHFNNNSMIADSPQNPKAYHFTTTMADAVAVRFDDMRSWVTPGSIIGIVGAPLVEAFGNYARVRPSWRDSGVVDTGTTFLDVRLVHVHHNYFYGDCRAFAGNKLNSSWVEPGAIKVGDAFQLVSHIVIEHNFAEMHFDAAELASPIRVQLMYRSETCGNITFRHNNLTMTRAGYDYTDRSLTALLVTLSDANKSPNMEPAVGNITMEYNTIRIRVVNQAGHCPPSSCGAGVVTISVPTARIGGFYVRHNDVDIRSLRGGASGFGLLGTSGDFDIVIGTGVKLGGVAIKNVGQVVFEDNAIALADTDIVSFVGVASSGTMTFSPGAGIVVRRNNFTVLPQLGGPPGMQPQWLLQLASSSAIALGCPSGLLFLPGLPQPLPLVCENGATIRLTSINSSDNTLVGTARNVLAFFAFVHVDAVTITRDVFTTDQTDGFAQIEPFRRAVTSAVLVLSTNFVVSIGTITIDSVVMRSWSACDLIPELIGRLRVVRRMGFIGLRAMSGTTPFLGNTTIRNVTYNATCLIPATGKGSAPQSPTLNHIGIVSVEVPMPWLVVMDSQFVLTVERVAFDRFTGTITKRTLLLPSEAASFFASDFFAVVPFRSSFGPYQFTRINLTRVTWTSSGNYLNAVASNHRQVTEGWQPLRIVASLECVSYNGEAVASYRSSVVRESLLAATFDKITPCAGAPAPSLSVSLTPPSSSITHDLSNSSERTRSETFTQVRPEPDLGVSASVLESMSSASTISASIAAIAGNNPSALLTSARGLILMRLALCKLRKSLKDAASQQQQQHEADELQRNVTIGILSQTSLDFPDSLTPGFNVGEKLGSAFRGAIVSAVCFLVLVMVTTLYFASLNRERWISQLLKPHPDPAIFTPEALAAGAPKTVEAELKRRRKAAKKQLKQEEEEEQQQQQQQQGRASAAASRFEDYYDEDDDVNDDAHGGIPMRSRSAARSERSARSNAAFSTASSASSSPESRERRMKRLLRTEDYLRFVTIHELDVQAAVDEARSASLLRYWSIDRIFLKVVVVLLPSLCKHCGMLAAAELSGFDSFLGITTLVVIGVSTLVCAVYVWVHLSKDVEGLDLYKMKKKLAKQGKNNNNVKNKKKGGAAAKKKSGSNNLEQRFLTATATRRNSNNGVNDDGDDGDVNEGGNVVFEPLQQEGGFDADNFGDGDQELLMQQQRFHNNNRLKQLQQKQQNEEEQESEQQQKQEDDDGEDDDGIDDRRDPQYFVEPSGLYFPVQLTAANEFYAALNRLLQHGLAKFLWVGSVTWRNPLVPLLSTTSATRVLTAPSMYTMFPYVFSAYCGVEQRPGRKLARYLEEEFSLSQHSNNKRNKYRYSYDRSFKMRLKPIYLFINILTTLVASAISGAGNIAPSSCAASFFVTLALTLPSAIAVLYLRPYILPARNLLLAAIEFSSCLGALIFTVVLLRDASTVESAKESISAAQVLSTVPGAMFGNCLTILSLSRFVIMRLAKAKVVTLSSLREYLPMELDRVEKKLRESRRRAQQQQGDEAAVAAAAAAADAKPLTWRQRFINFISGPGGDSSWDFFD